MPACIREPPPVHKAVFLDRDGILNEVVMRGSVVGSPRCLREFQLRTGAVSMTQQLAELGFLLLVATNQPDVGRSLMEASELERMHARLRAELPLHDIAACLSGDDLDPRRKPNPGMLLELAERHVVDLASSYFLGDGVKDMEAGRRAGVRTIWLETDYNRQRTPEADLRVTSLDEVVGRVKHYEQS